MQAPADSQQPCGVVYNTAMNRPDAALALALLYGLQGRREAKIASVCVNGSGLAAAVYCDIVSHYYALGQRNSNAVLPTGFASVSPAPQDPRMVIPAIEQKTDKGEPQYARDIRKVSDTSLPEAVMRNSITYNAKSVIVLSAPATYLARALDLPATKQLMGERVKMLVVVDSGAPQDPAAMRKVLAEMPADVFFCPKEIGEAIRYPAASIEKDFAWAPVNPVVDAYRAFHPMPYDAPGYDLAALLYAVHPDQGLFELSPAGAVTVSDEGKMSFAPGGNGKVRSLVLDPSKEDSIVAKIVELATLKPVTPAIRVRPGAAPAKTANDPAAESNPPRKPPA